jgi:hypothetical protein
MAMVRKIVAVLWVLMIGCSGAFSQVLENYAPKILENYPATRIGAYDQIEVMVDLRSFPKSDLKVGLPEGAVVFWEDRLWIMAKSDTTIILPVGVVSEFVGEKLASENKLTVIRAEIMPQSLVLQKGFFANVEAAAAPVQVSPRKVDTLQPEVRQKSAFPDFFFVALVSVLLLVAIYKLIYPFVLGMIITPTSVVSAEDFSESTGLQKFFSLDVIFFLLIINMAAFLLLMLVIDITERESVLFVVKGDMNQLFLYWLLGSLIMTGLGVLKFSFLRAFGFLFELNRIVVPHFFYLLRIISITIFVIAFVVTVILLNNFIDLGITVQYSLYAFFWIYLVGVFLLYWIMSNRVPFKNYHLFVYICTTELVPLLAISKIVIG